MAHESQLNSSRENRACGSKRNAAPEHNIEHERMQQSLSKIKYKLLVMSGKGGVGKSSISVNMAVALSRKGLRVGLMDVDLHGPSIATMIGFDAGISSSDDRCIIPKSYNDHLKVISIEYLLQNKDQPLIWRGPVKMGVIRQFMTDVQWGDLDILIIDAPPGTGDEPLTVAQTVKDAKAVIVTTPQQVALADVKKSINFCRKIDLDILGIVENMGAFSCPCCGKSVEVFKSDGGETMAREMGVAFLGTLPFDCRLVRACDDGRPMMDNGDISEFSTALETCIAGLIDRLMR